VGDCAHHQFAKEYGVVPEESGNPPNQHDETVRRLERRIENLERAADRENKWWRGGLIAALVLVALSILIAGHHRRHRPPPIGMGGPMGMQGWGGPRMMPYGPPPPPNWGYGPGPGWGGPQNWHYHQWNGPGSDGPQGGPPKG
jgi:hypothetical protein